MTRHHRITAIRANRTPQNDFHAPALSHRDDPPRIAESPGSGDDKCGNTVTITGTNFTSASTVKFRSTAAKSVTFASPTQLSAVAPAKASGVVNVTVTTSGTTSSTSKHSLYAYGLPTVSSFTPTSGITGTTVTITGKNFVPGAKVKFGSKASPKVTSCPRPS